MTAPTHIASTKWDRIMGDLVSTLKDDINGGEDASTTVNVTSAAAQAVLSVAATTSFTVGEAVIIGPGTAREEVKVIASIQAATSLTMTENLTYEHTLAQADAIWQGWYNYNMNRAETVDSADDLGAPIGGPWPMCKLYAGPAEVIEYLTGYDYMHRTANVVAWMDVQEHNPTDQKPDESFQMLYADLKRAIMADWTLGGEAIITRIGSHMRVTEDVYPVDPDEQEEPQGIPFVGVFLPLDIEYMEKRGDAYT